MAKLNQWAKGAGFNAGEKYLSKVVRVSEIVIDPELSAIFKIHDNIRDEIAEKMKKMGYDKSQPLSVQKGTNILLDGHTRLAAAKKAGLEEIPIVEMEIENREEALMYTFERQALRRSLTGPEILKAAEMIPDKRAENGEGRAAVILAKRIGVSPATIYQARKILKEASEEDIKAIENGDMSIKAAYTKTAAVKKEDKAVPNSASNQFLLRAVTILAEHDQEDAAEILISEYLPTQKEREEFGNLLSENQRSLAALFLLPQKNPGTPPKADTQNGIAIR